MLFQPRTDHIGLDISDHSLKAVQFIKTLNGRLKLVGLSAQYLADGIIKDGTIKNTVAFTKAVSQLLLKPTWGKFTTNLIVASLPESRTFIKMITVPSSNQDIAQAVKWEAQHHIPLPLEDTYWDWQTIKSTPNFDNSRQPILLAAAPKDIVESYNQALNQTHLTAIAMEIEAQAIVRSLIPINQVNQTEATMIIDIGGDHTSLIMFSFDTIQFTVSLPISGRAITQTVADTIKLDATQAELAKIKYGLDPSAQHGAIYKILQNMTNELVHRLQESLVFYQEHFPSNPPATSIILCGGAANLKKIDQLLTSEMKIPVRLGNPWCNVSANVNPRPEADALSYTTAIGLALRDLI